MSAPLSFNILARDGKARRGAITTAHGRFDTPAFMPVGTAGALKSLTPEQVASTGTQIVLANTYHLLLRPGPSIVAGLGGLHRFMQWNGAILTDSGGFQVFSLADLRRMDDDGVVFRSHIDGASITLTPEVSIAVQNQLGADIIMAFDECPPLPADDAALSAAVGRTVRWARRCKQAHGDQPQALYGIVQGGLNIGLRRSCLADLVDIGFPGYAIGGLSVGEPPPEMWSLLDDFADDLPGDRPRYLMGVGTPLDLVHAVSSGMDQFDCVLPTRNGRKGYAFTSTGVVRLRNAEHRLSREPLDAACDCYCCRWFCRGYLRHLFQIGETLGGTLVSLHNIAFYQRLMSRMRTEIDRGSFAAWKLAFLNGPLGCPAAAAPNHPG
ncbi:MAG: tRNA guanosine(34) transglycosylase Tgt [Phycisphaerales bacterium]|nr:tRNA guanosine(34) transglycosylase Tgt [Phycisphaerales bacterium]